MRVVGITTVVAFACLFFIHREINPTWINHLVIIRDDAMHSPPLLATLQGDVRWSQELEINAQKGPGPSTGKLVVANIYHAWSDGQLTVSDSKGNVWANVAVQNPGRYCGTLVILIDAKGESHTAWNSMPHE